MFGATRNPWDTARSAGGSSGGAAVALACRLVPLADGSDLGGSLRNPAAWNGVVGLRPTPGVVPSWPDETPWLPFSVDGPIGRTAGDVALLLGAMAGPDPRAPLSQRAAALDLTGPLDADLGGRRVAWSPSLGGLPIEPAVLAAARGRGRAADAVSASTSARTSPTWPAQTRCSRPGGRSCSPSRWATCTTATARA